MPSTKMDKDYFVKLTSAVYRVTDLFPEEEPLKLQIRELANRVLANLILANPTPQNASQRKELSKDIKILDSYFELAEAQDWVDSRNFLALQREYDRIQKFIEDKPILTELDSPLRPPASPKLQRGERPASTQRGESEASPMGRDAGKTVENSFPKLCHPRKPTNGRQEKILNILKEKKEVRVGELIQLFPQVSRRTLIRDLKDLYRGGVVTRVGNGRGVQYEAKL